MLTVAFLMHVVLLGQTPAATEAPATAAPPAQLLQPLVVDATPSNGEAAPSTQTPGPDSVPCPPAVKSEPAFSIFSRPPFADRMQLAFLAGAGSGRFGTIDWESRPNADRAWWLGRWPIPEDVQIYCGIGFGIHWWAGPVHDTAPVPVLPPQVFDLYFDGSWSQRWSEWFATEVRVRPGLYTDFRTTPPDAFRIPAEALGVYKVDDDLYLVGGAQHLQRNRVKVLPIAGVLWQPTPRWEVNLVFPEPKIAFELSTKRHLWGYVATEYGGGRWTYQDEAGHSERVESSDYRVAVGIEWREDYLKNLTAQKTAAFLELGYVFHRELRFTGREAPFDPRPTWMIRFGTVW
jgi:hypothetical protein